MPANAATTKINIVVDNHPIQSDVAPYIQSGCTMVPCRVISESLAATVEYDTLHIKITTNDGKKINLQIGSKKATVQKDGETKQLTLTVAPKIKTNRTFVPLRFVAESLDVPVDYQAAQRTVVIETPPIYIAGQAVNSMTTHQYMTMGGWIYGYYGNANVAEFYRLLTAGIGNEVTAPEYFGRHINLDVECFYYLDTEFGFYHGMPEIDEEMGQEKPGLQNYTVYSFVSGFPDASIPEGYTQYLLLDEKTGKWYQYNMGAWEKLHIFWDKLYGGAMSEELLNNVV